MWKEVLLNYGIFLLELLTVFGVLAFIVMLILEAKKQPEEGSISVVNLTEKFTEQQKALEACFLSEEELKQQEKAEKKSGKRESKS